MASGFLEKKHGSPPNSTVLSSDFVSAEQRACSLKNKLLDPIKGTLLKVWEAGGGRAHPQEFSEDVGCNEAKRSF